MISFLSTYMSKGKVIFLISLILSVNILITVNIFYHPPTTHYKFNIPAECWSQTNITLETNRAYVMVIYTNQVEYLFTDAQNFTKLLNETLTECEFPWFYNEIRTPYLPDSYQAIGYYFYTENYPSYYPLEHWFYLPSGIYTLALFNPTNYSSNVTVDLGEPVNNAMTVYEMASFAIFNFGWVFTLIFLEQRKRNNKKEILKN